MTVPPEVVQQQAEPVEVVTKPKRQKVEKPKPVAFSWNLAAYSFLEVVKAVDAVINYGAKVNESTEITFEIGENGITLCQMDSSRVSMIDFALAKTGFNEYNLVNGGKVCFNAKDILAVLAGVKQDRYDNDGTLKIEGEKLLLTLENGVDLTLDIQHSEYNRTFTLKAIEPSQEETPPTPKIDFKTTFKIEKPRLLQILKDAEKVASGHVTIIAEENNVTFKTDSADTARKFETVLPKSEKLLDLTIIEPAKATYNLDLLKTMIENVPKDTSVITISYSSDMPMLLETGQYEKLSMFLAPRIEMD